MTPGTRRTELGEFARPGGSGGTPGLLSWDRLPTVEWLVAPASTANRVCVDDAGLEADAARLRDAGSDPRERATGSVQPVDGFTSLRPVPRP